MYSCLLERTSLPFRNKWLDEENRVYIIFTVEEIMEILGKSNKTAVKILNELNSPSGSRIIIMTVANSTVKSRVLKLLPKLKTRKIKNLCTV
ncbi:replication initiator protein A [Campylobacter portucalensis]|uniref:replication initiator protein A n=1 Tax=Campylobacter portucalensis TaxID=2608384 RepID=UPI003898E681